MTALPFRLVLTSERARELAALLWDDPTRGAASIAAQIAAELRVRRRPSGA